MKAEWKVLFLAREGCPYSKDIEEILVRNPHVSLTTHRTKNFLEKLPQHILRWNGDYLLSFRNTSIVPATLLGQCKIASINFHPGPVEYPGSGAGSWALLDGVTSFGVTAHLMEAKVDAGPVISTVNFPITETDNSVSLLKKTHSALHKLAVEVIQELLAGGRTYLDLALQAHFDLRWADRRRRMETLNKLRSLSPEVSPEKLQLLVRALHSEDFPLTLTLHGHNFVLKGPPQSGTE